jgi:hypothetical protein
MLMVHGDERLAQARAQIADIKQRDAAAINVPVRLHKNQRAVVFGG